MDKHNNGNTSEFGFDARPTLLWGAVILALIALTALIAVLFSSENDPKKTVNDFSDPISSVAPTVSEMELSDPQAESSADEDAFLHGWVINSMGYTYLYGNLGLEQFNYSDKVFERFKNCVSAIASQAPDGTSVYCMPVPTQVGFLYASIPDEIKKQDDFFNSSQSCFLDTLEEALPENITLVGLYEPFSESLKSGCHLFFRTDRNWTSDGAFLAYKQFCKASGNPATSTDIYSKTTYSDFLGSFYRATQAKTLESEPETFLYYHNEDTDACKVILYEQNSIFKNYRLTGNGFLDPSDCYLSYLGTEGAYFKIETPCLSSQKLLIVGDESAAAMLPFLIENYSEIHYICPTRFRGNLQDIFTENKFKDILIVSYLTNAVKGDFPVFLETIAGVMNG